MKQLSIEHATPSAQGASRSYLPAIGCWTRVPTREQRLAHDLGNHCTALGGLAQVGRLMKNAEAKDSYFKRIENAVGDMACMVRECLANGPTDLREPIDPAMSLELLQSVVSLMRPRYQAKEVELTISHMPGIGICRLARIPLKQALVNVLDNAVHATLPGGRVALRAMPCTSPRGLRIQVQDNGSGIPKELMCRVFTPGFTTRADGYGLGLSVTREVVEVMHGGRLSIQSRPGQGTKVHIFLPS